MASNLYNSGLLKIANNTINFAADTIGAILVSDGYVFNKAHDFLNDVTTHEVTNSVGTGYERKTLANKTVSLVGDAIVFDADNVLYTAINTAEVLSKIVIYKDNGSDAANDLIACIDYNDLPTNGSDVEVQFNVAGVFRITNQIV